MARPSAEVILCTDSVSHSQSDGVTDILYSQGYWCLAYQGQPVQIRTSHWSSSGEIHKYPRTGFNNRAHCERLSERMNRLFDTEDFHSQQLYTDITQPRRNK